jgi:transcriptional regulator with XRE-family HTH domain
MELDGVVDDRRYAVTVGARLRAIRAQQRLSLQEVEVRSREEFKASVLGAYERGERAISVARLQRLARFYAVPVDQLLPGDDGPSFGPRPGDGQLGGATNDVAAHTHATDDPVRIDLAALGKLDTPESELLTRFLGLIQLQRGDFNGQVLTVRRSDLGALACILDVAPASAAEKLCSMDLLFRPLPA